MQLELDYRMTEKGTNLVNGNSAEQKAMAFIRARYDLSNYIVALHLVEPITLAPRTEASLVSMRKKARLIEGIGAKSAVYVHDCHSSIDDVKQQLDINTHDPDVIGEIIQLPLPHHLNGVRHYIDPAKDIDSINPHNDVWNVCATAEAATRLLELHRPYVRKIGLLGARGFVGKHVSWAIQKKEIGELVQVEFDDTLTLMRNCETIVSAVGQPNLIQRQHIPTGYLGIDIGNTKSNNEFKGDFDFNSVDGVIMYLTPVPGGMGPLEMIIIAERIVKNAVDRWFEVQFAVK